MQSRLKSPEPRFALILNDDELDELCNIMAQHLIYLEEDEKVIENETDPDMALKLRFHIANKNELAKKIVGKLDQLVDESSPVSPARNKGGAYHDR